MVLEVDVEPLATGRSRFVDGDRNQLGADTAMSNVAATIVSWIQACRRPSHATLTKPTSRSPDRAMTHPRL
jgi:hypothetical protein